MIDCCLHDAQGEVLNNDEVGGTLLLVHLTGWTVVPAMSIEELMKMHYFPASPCRPSIGFHIDLLELCSDLYDISNVNHYSLLKAVTKRFTSPLPRDVYERFMDSMRYFKYCNHLLHHGVDHVVVTKCPACSPDGSSNASLFKVTTIRGFKFSFVMDFILQNALAGEPNHLMTLCMGRFL